MITTEVDISAEVSAVLDSFVEKDLTVTELYNTFVEQTNLITVGDQAALQRIYENVAMRSLMRGHERARGIDAPYATWTERLRTIADDTGIERLRELTERAWTNSYGGAETAEVAELNDLREAAHDYIALFTENGLFGHETKEEFEHALGEALGTERKSEGGPS